MVQQQQLEALTEEVKRVTKVAHDEARLDSQAIHAEIESLRVDTSKMNYSQMQEYIENNCIPKIRQQLADIEGDLYTWPKIKRWFAERTWNQWACAWLVLGMSTIGTSFVGLYHYGGPPNAAATAFLALLGLIGFVTCFAGPAICGTEQELATGKKNIETHKKIKFDGNDYAVARVEGKHREFTYAPMKLSACKRFYGPYSHKRGEWDFGDNHQNKCSDKNLRFATEEEAERFIRTGDTTGALKK